MDEDAGSMERIFNCGTGAIVTKSIGLKSREGYPNPTVIELEHGILNAMGLPNPGIEEFGEELKKLKKSKIPIIGPVFFNHDPLVYTSYLIPPLMWVFFRYTRWGLGMRAVGEYPKAASAGGLRVISYRWAGVLVGGYLVGFGGAYLSLAYTHLWTNGLSAGRGWIAVALVIFSFWHPGRAIVGAYLFGGVMAFQLRLQATGTHIPSSLLLMLPYALTVIVLVFSSWKGQGFEAPAALGVNIEPSE